MANKATLKPFKKGEDPRRNVTGANRGSKWLTTILEDELKKKVSGQKESYDKLLVKRVLKSAIVDGDMRAVEHIWERVEGKTTPEPFSTVPTQTLIIINAPAQVAIKQ